VSELSGEPTAKVVEPEVKIPVAAFVPEDYVEDIGQRLSFYKRLSLAPDSATVYDVMDEMQDRYGPVPINVEHLRDLVLVKLIMKQIVAKQIEVGPKAIVVELLPETTLSPDKVMALIASTRGQYEVRPGIILVRKLQGRESANLMETALLISREVARCARDAS
jgi:transcription-repair coupling factor (superfamily II helicase)